MNMTDWEFQELKRYFDQNDTIGGAQFLTQLMQEYSISGSGCAAEELIAGYSYDNPTVVYSAPIAGQGLIIHDFHDGHQQRKSIGIDPMLMMQAQDASRLAADLQAELYELRDKVQQLTDMHSGNADHTPTIISTREQWEEMKDKIEEDEKVYVETAFSRAMGVLE